MEPLKHLLNADGVRQAGHHLTRHSPGFDRARFEALALHGLDTLELKARAMQIADALEATLPADFDAACAAIEAALAPPLPLDAPPATAAAAHPDAGLSGWIVWPLGEVVARQGNRPDRLPRALAALQALTQRFTAEFAIRPLLRDHPQPVLAALHRWARDPSPHVRRLASEGSRPRLPWGLRLQALVKDPTPTVELLRLLQDDPSDSVRRSVANHLNDIAHDHPERLADWLDAHLPDAPPPRRALLRHASRTAIKQGHPRVLAAWGLGQGFQGTVALRVSPAALVLGESLRLEVMLHSTAARPQAVQVDYAVHHVKADGRRTPKVFKGWARTLAPGEALTLVKAHAVRPITTRRYHPGEHAVDVRVNGQVGAQAVFHLRIG
jgi:3-methyladenine DNA glycosylase AlkC